eukprot:3668656-Amphidinium_carterae.1
MEGVRSRIAKKRDNLEDFPKAAEKLREREREQLQAQLRQGASIRVDHVPGILSSPEVVSPLRLLCHRMAEAVATTWNETDVCSHRSPNCRLRD